MSESPMNVKELFEQAGLGAPATVSPELTATVVTDDSRKVIPGALFVATRGTVADGHRFIPGAMANGAAVIVAEEGGAIPASADGNPDAPPVVTVSDSRDALGRLAHAFYGNPTRDMLVLGVTGTNGKTTTTYMLESVLREAGHTPGVVGTIEYRYAGKAVPAPNTTPSAVQLGQILAEMRDAKVDALAIELSSHAADQRRISGLEIDVAILTNITQDHLDYHGTMEAYAAAKESIFSDYLLRPKKGSRKREPVAVFNVDDGYGARFARSFRGRVVTVGIDTADADLRATGIRSEAGGTSFTVERREGNPLEVRMQLIGPFNVMNALGVIGACLAAGVPEKAVVDGLAKVRSDFGRFEAVPAGQDFTVVVDYAHTPDALENVLRNARLMTEGKLICVFGCGGDRDNKKRPLMGEIAGNLSDHVVVTNDNPRTEDPVRITEMILEGVRRSRVAGENVDVLHDRKEAIARAIDMARTGDFVLIAGKGHEDYQIVGTEKHHFDDREVAKEVIAARMVRATARD